VTLVSYPRIVSPKAPPIKTQGIKTKLVPFILSNISWDGEGRWLEPFLGSGAVLLNAAPARALAADTNETIIAFYSDVLTGSITPASARIFLEREGKLLSERGDEHYYAVRERFNETKSPLDFLFLNRSCFNGVVRFNSKGKFNVPFCRKPERFAPALVTKICNQIAWASRQMSGRKWTFAVQDWRDTLALAGDVDFVYLDPPYVGRHTDYYNQWSGEDADELAAAVASLQSGFAYSMWKENRYRENTHLAANFADFPMVTFEHFYHIGATESLRNAMEEALVLSRKSVAPPPKEEAVRELRQLTLLEAD